MKKERRERELTLYFRISLLKNISRNKSKAKTVLSVNKHK